MSEEVLQFQGASGMPVPVSSTNPLPASATTNITQVNGATFSPSNPLIQEYNIQNWLRGGKSFAATTGALTGAAGPGFCALSVFNPANSGKTLLVYMAQFECDAQQFADLYAATVDPNFNGANKGTITPVNLSLGNAAVSAANCTYSKTGAETETGTKFLSMTNVATTTLDMLLFPRVIQIPPGNGLVIYVHQNSQGFIANMGWTEF